MMNERERRFVDELNSVIVAMLMLLPGQIFFVEPVLADSLQIDRSVPVPLAASEKMKNPVAGGITLTHSYLSATVERLSQKIDTFFGEDRIYEEATGTYLQARGSVIYSEAGAVDFNGGFRAKIDLPQLEEKINLILESHDDRTDPEDFGRITTGNNLLDELEDSDLSAALQLMIAKKRRWHLSLRPGLKFSNPPEFFTRLRIRRTQPFAETWLSRGTAELGYYSDRGWENKWLLELERDIGEDNFFRSASTFLWREESPGNQLLGQTFMVTHVFDPLQSIAFEIGTSAETRPVLRDRSHFGSIRYRRNVHWNWLFLELKPQLIFARENDFDADPAVVLTLEVLLGGKYLDQRAALRPRPGR